MDTAIREAVGMGDGAVTVKTVDRKTLDHIVNRIMDENREVFDLLAVS